MTIDTDTLNDIKARLADLSVAEVGGTPWAAEAYVLVGEIERLRALLDGRTVPCSQCNAAAEREATLRALLTELNDAVDLCDLTTNDDDLVSPIQNRVRVVLDGGPGSVAHQEWESGVAWERHADALDGGERAPVHVDPINGDDANDGSTEATAKRTISAAVQASSTTAIFNEKPMVRDYDPHKYESKMPERPTVKEQVKSLPYINGVACATCDGTGWRTTIHDGINVKGGAELTRRCPDCSGVSS